MKKLLFLLVLALASIAQIQASDVSLPLTAGASQKLYVGTFVGGTTVSVTMSGNGDLIDSRWTVKPDGSLNSPASGNYSFANQGAPYSTQDGGDGINHFPGGGANFDSTGSGYGFAGKMTTDTTDPAAIRNGAIVGTFASNPTRADWFFVGFGGTFTVPARGGALYLAVSETVSGDNHGTYTGTVNGTTPPEAKWDAGRDLAANEKPDGGAQETANPNGTVPQWSYGYRDGSVGGTALTRFAPAQHTNHGADGQSFEGYDTGSEAVLVNTTDHNLVISFCCGPLYPVAPREMIMGVNTAGRNTVVRWTSPAAGTYTYHADWRDIDPNGGDGAAGYVVVNGQQTFGQTWPNGNNNGAVTTQTVTLNAGDTIDFLLNNGANVGYDTARVTFTVDNAPGSAPPVAPPHGGLSTTTFTVNGSSSTNTTLTGPVLSFAAIQTGRPADLAVRVQSTHTPEPNDATNTSWTDLPTNTGGRMTLDVLNNSFVLNTTSYPAQPGLYFRAVSSAPPYPDSISNYVGFFEASSAGNHLPPVVLLFKRQGTLADLSFTAGVKSAASDVAVRIQSSTTPAVESSWTDLADGQSGHMTRSTNANFPDAFKLLANNLPAADHIYFRAIAQKSGYLDSISNMVGAFTLTKDTPPVVTITPPQNNGGSGTPADPYIVSGTLSIRATATTDRSITALKVKLDSKTIYSVTDGSKFVNYFVAPTIGDHVLELVAIDDLNAVARAGTGAVYIRVVPNRSSAGTSKAERVEGAQTSATTTAGKVYTVVNSGGSFSDASTWKDAQGQNGVPGPDDIAVIGSASVRIDYDASVLSLSINGGTLIGPGNLDVLGTMTLSAMSVNDYVGIFIHAGAVCELLNRADVRFNPGNQGQTGKFYNHGTVNVHGSGGVIGLDKFSNTGTLNWEYPVSIPLNANSDPAADLRGVFANSLDNSGLVTGFDPNSLISQDGAGIISHDGGGLVAADGGAIISHDGGGIISHDGGGIISHDGGGLIGNDGTSLLEQSGNGLVAAGGGNINGGAPIGRQRSAAADSSDSGFIQTGGNTDLSAVTIVGPVTLNGGILSGSGMIVGDVTNNGGYISPGHSPGSISVFGNFTQGANGTLIVENGGATPDLYDQVQVSGTATLGGMLDVKLINGYKPDPADTFNPLSYASVSGNFAAVSSNAHITANSTGLLVTSDAGVPNPASGQPKNISTRARVEAGDGVTIAGFIISGNASKKVLIRGLGPELVKYGVSNTLADPILDLHKPGGEVISNDNWKQTQQADIEASGLAPHFDVEAAIVATLDPGEYTAILSGNNGGTGVGLVEVYDLEIGGAPKLVNISTRCMVQTGDNVLIGGVIIGGNEPAKVLVRAIGPSLAPYGIKDVLADPELELHDSNGGVIANGDWRETQEAEITATHMAPADDHEAAILATLVPGNYTAIVRGKDDTIGVALVEVYLLP